MIDNGLALGVLEQRGVGNARAMRGRLTETRRSRLSLLSRMIALAHSNFLKLN